MGAFIHRLARWMALLGGAVLLVIVAVTCASIAGRALQTVAYLPQVQENLGWLSRAILATGARPVPGDFELTEAGMAFAIFAFLPWCQVQRGHATVDLMAAIFPGRWNRFTDLVTEIIMSAVVILIAWRLWIGMLDKHRYGETTFILQFPVWWGFLVAGIAAWIAVMVSLWSTWERFTELRGGVSGGNSTGGHL